MAIRILARLLGALIGGIGAFLLACLCGTPLPNYSAAMKSCVDVLTIGLLESRYLIW
jgi:hypothetical protein